MKRLYRVVDYEDGRQEDHAPMVSGARTEAGFLKLFYQRWPTAPRGNFFASVTADGGADIHTTTGKKVAAFQPKGS